jgi:Holliday junction DNA helicase RuvA
MDLISLAGVGPKTAILILNNDYQKVAKWIAKGDIDKLNQIPNVGTKLARQLVFELQEKYNYFHNGNKKEITTNTLDVSKNTKLKDLKVTLKTLGFQSGQINMAMENIDNLTLPLEELIEKSINVISNAK